jgi:hypothetical protein
MNKIFGTLLVSAVFLSRLASASESHKSIERPEMLVLKSESSFALRILSVDLGSKSIVGLRSCDAPDYFGCCKSPWRAFQRRLSPEELRTLLHLAQEAKLFNGQSKGGHIDLAFRQLEVHSGNEIAVLMVTLNDSFQEPGPRRMLLERLHALQSELIEASPSTKKLPEAPHRQ